MSIEYQNVSVGTASAALSGAAVQTAWRDALDNHASGAWSIEHEFDASTIHWVVMKNDHTISGLDRDFYVCIGRDTSSGALGCMVGEVYVAASKILSIYAPRANSSAQILSGGDFGFPSAMTYTLGSALPPETHSYPYFKSITQAATERMVTAVDADYAVLNVNGHSMYVGALTDLIVPKTGLVATPAIGCVWLNSNSSGDSGGLTRHPIAAADAPMTVYYPHTVVPFMSGQYMDACLMQNQAFLTGMYGYPDRFQNDRVAASEIAALMHACWSSSGTNNRADKTGHLRAKYKGIRLSTGPYAAVAYDTIVIDAKKHVVLMIADLNAYSPYFAPPNPSGYNTALKIMASMNTGVAA